MVGGESAVCVISPLTGAWTPPGVMAGSMAASHSKDDVAVPEDSSIDCMC